MQQQVQADNGTVKISAAKMDELADRYRRGLISHAAYTKAQDDLLEAALSGAELR